MRNFERLGSGANNPLAKCVMQNANLHNAIYLGKILKFPLARNLLTGISVWKFPLSFKFQFCFPYTRISLHSEIWLFGKKKFHSLFPLTVYYMQANFIQAARTSRSPTRTERLQPCLPSSDTHTTTAYHIGCFHSHLAADAAKRFSLLTP